MHKHSNLFRLLISKPFINHCPSIAVPTPLLLSPPSQGTEGKLRAEWFLQRVADFDLASAQDYIHDHGHPSSSSSAAAVSRTMMTAPEGDRSTRLRQLYRDAALIPYRLSTLEQESRQAEQALVQAWQMKNAQRSLNSHRAKHPYPQMDGHFLALSVPAANPHTATILEPLAMTGRGGGGASGAMLQTLFPHATITPASLLHLDPHAAGIIPLPPLITRHAISHNMPSSLSSPPSLSPTSPYDLPYDP